MNSQLNEVKIPSKIPKKNTIENNVETKKRAKKRKLDTKNKKPTKKTKIEQQNARQNDFGNLKMVNLNQYDIPTQFHAIEMNTDTSYLDVIKNNFKYSTSEPEHYKNAYRALLYLNEASEHISLQEFNQKHIRLSSSIGNQFRIQISVSN